MKFFSFAVAAASILILAGLVAFGSRGSKPTSEVDSSTVKNLLEKSAPSFTLKDQQGIVYSPENLKGRKAVLFFNEGLMCYPACWDQIAEFGKDERFNKEDAVALSIVPDTVKDWEPAFKKMPELDRAKILFDPDKSVSKTFDALNTASSMHKGAMPGHTYILLDRAGVVRYVYDDPAMAVNNNLIFEELSKIN